MGRVLMEHGSSTYGTWVEYLWNMGRVLMEHGSSTYGTWVATNPLLSTTTYPTINDHWTHDQLEYLWNLIDQFAPTSKHYPKTILTSVTEVYGWYVLCRSSTNGLNTNKYHHSCCHQVNICNKRFSKFHCMCNKLTWWIIVHVTV